MVSCGYYELGYFEKQGLFKLNALIDALESWYSPSKAIF